MKEPCRPWWRRTPWMLGAAVLIFSSTLPAETVPTRGAVDARIRTAVYDPKQVYRLTGFVGYHLDLEFEEGETFLGISAGDPEALNYSAHDNILTLRPRAEMAQMNLAVSTSRRRYYFEYSVSARRPNAAVDEVMYAVRFSYPAGNAGGEMTTEQRVALELARAAVSRPRNFDYWFCGGGAVRPVAASDDGVQTRLTFAPNRELPALFVRNDDGTESLLNFSVEGGDVVIHRVAARFIVRRGKLTGCIVNKAFVGSGLWLESGTIAPEIRRDVKGAAP